MRETCGCSMVFLLVLCCPADCDWVAELGFVGLGFFHIPVI